jgi:hypothetical protein
MKKIVFLAVVVVISSLLFTFFGCSSLKPISYALAGDETNSASISFISDASFVSFNGSGLPNPEKGTFWDPILFPSGLPLEITVHAYYQQEATTVTNAGLLGALISTAVTSGVTASRSVNTDVLFTCPPLEPGKEYSLSFRKAAGGPGNNKLILTDIATKKIIYQQEFETR